MVKEESISEGTECLHEYIVCLGKNKETDESYNYCLNCGERILKTLSRAFYVDADYYLEEYPLETEFGRTQKLIELRKQFNELMLENGVTSPAFVIDDFRDMVEFKKNKMNQARGKVC